MIAVYPLVGDPWSPENGCLTARSSRDPAEIQPRYSPENGCLAAMQEGGLPSGLGVDSVSSQRLFKAPLHILFTAPIREQATQKLVPKKCFAHNAKELEVVKKKGIR